jgi:predicted O-linked N-acetylglucosamine transferase (SPINDLY family)
MQINKKLETIAHLTEHTVHTPRQKRGLFNGFSTGLKWFIGAPDANDAKFYSAAIKTLQNKNRETLTMMRQEIHIMNSAIISYSNSVQSLKEVKTKQNTNIETFNNFTQSVTKKVTQLFTAERATSCNPNYLRNELRTIIKLQSNLQYPISIDDDTKFSSNYFSVSKISVIY